MKNGNRVVATLRRKEAISDLAERYPSSQLLIVQTDVVKTSEVAAAFAKAQEVFGRIDVVFNNAGMAILGEMESMSDQDARQIFEVNYRRKIIAGFFIVGLAWKSCSVLQQLRMTTVNMVSVFV